MKKKQKSKLSLEKLNISKLSNSSAIYILGGNKKEITYTTRIDTKASSKICAPFDTTSAKQPDKTDKKGKAL